MSFFLIMNSHLGFAYYLNNTANPAQLWSITKQKLVLEQLTISESSSVTSSLSLRVFTLEVWSIFRDFTGCGSPAKYPSLEGLDFFAGPASMSSSSESSRRLGGHSYIT